MAAQKLYERLSAKIAETEGFRYPDKARDCDFDYEIINMIGELEREV